MPIYEYRCDKGHTIEVMQRMSDGPLEKCTVCGAPVQRVFHPVAVHFKGSGFYNTDYGKQKGKGTKGESESGSSSSDSKDGKGSSKDGKDSKPSSSDKSDKKPSKAPAASSSDS